MKIQTMSVVVGDNSCNSSCPFCISKISGILDHPVKDVNWRNFRIACNLAEQSGANTILLTGKGEPTLHPNLILRHIEFLKAHYKFPFIELQTNGIKIGDPNYQYEAHGYAINAQDCPSVWYEAGLTTICLSAVHYERERNQEIYGKDYPDIKELVDRLHKIGLTVRLSVMLLKGFIDSIGKLRSLAQFCCINEIAQLTIRPIDGPSKGCKQADFVDKHTLYDEWTDIKSYVDEEATLILNLAHGGKVYDLYGQNICLGTCMTKDDTEDSMRQLIFFPNGELRYNWIHSGSILLKGRDS